jgi:hypothetical protein
VQKGTHFNVGHSVETAVWVAAACERLIGNPLFPHFVGLLIEQQAGTVSHSFYPAPPGFVVIVNIRIRAICLDA